MAQIGFIGLGTMGGPMAANLVRGGHSVTGFDVNEKAVAKHSENGGKVASSSAEVAKSAELIFTMLPNSEHVEAALFGVDGAVGTLPNGSIIVEMSTINPLKTDAIRKKLLDKKILMIDAPIGRTSVEAAQGKSLIMVGGEPADISQVMPVLKLLGDTIIDCGGPGTGSRMKIVNNYMTTSLNVLTAEVLTLAESIGLGESTCLEVLNGTPAGRGHLSTTYPVKVLKGDISPAFMIDLALKDLGIGIELAKDVGAPSDIGESARESYLQAKNEGRGHQDWTALLLSSKDRVNKNKV